MTCYIVALEWILCYYYTGVPSYSWYVVWSLEKCFEIFSLRFYPYHYISFVCDLKDLSSSSIKFELGSAIPKVVGSSSTGKQAIHATSLPDVYCGCHRND